MVRPSARATTRPQSSGEREALLEHLTQALDAIGFLSRQNPEHIVADLRGLFARAGLTRRDVKIWRGIARQMLWAARRAERARPQCFAGCGFSGRTCAR